MTIKCIAIDDEQFALKALKNHCAMVPYLELCAAFSDPYQAIAFLRGNSPDLIFLDIQMPGISGIQIANTVLYKPGIIFTTAHSNYAVEGFSLNAIDYLLKPFDFQRFLKAVEKAKEKFELMKISKSLQKYNDFITVKIEYKNVKIYTSEILYIEALDNYSKIFTAKKSYLTLQGLGNIHSLLPTNEFVRIHKSFIIPLSKVSGYTSKNVVAGSKMLPVGRAYSKVFLSRINN
jgi:two-component system, LytTR family, response regulator LytT